MSRIVAAILFLVALGTAHASNESLALRVNAQGEYEVVLRGISDICGQHFQGLSIATVGIGSIAIHTLVSGSGGGCGPEAPSFSPYEIAVPVGALAPGSYSVVWTTSVCSSGCPTSTFLVATLVAEPLRTEPIPTLSHSALALLAILLLTAAQTLAKRSNQGRKDVT